MVASDALAPSLVTSPLEFYMNHLDALEAESVYILREAFAKLEKLAILWSLGKDRNVVLWLVRKAFFGQVPFPVMHGAQVP